MYISDYVKEKLIHVAVIMLISFFQGPNGQRGITGLPGPKGNGVSIDNPNLKLHLNFCVTICAEPHIAACY